jgi:hypothetical protein
MPERLPFCCTTLAMRLTSRPRLFPVEMLHRQVGARTGGKCRVHGLYSGQSWVLADALHLCAGVLSSAHHLSR